MLQDIIKTGGAALLSIALSCPAWAAGAPPASQTAKAMASAYVADFKDMLRDQEDISPPERACIERIPDTAVLDAMQDVIAATLNPNELDQLERFYASPEGQRVFAIYRRWGDKENPPSDAELEEILPLIKSKTQTKLFDATSFQSLGSIKVMDAFYPVLARCSLSG
ncbi:MULTISPECIES: hypothetical protein [unclassified Lysobacter]|uniref:hypothetical protein n=1 Tax=unclassified Lysobacter TaxID=2635362 RepID=UPI0006F28E20|nr:MULTISPECIES: hypothetical protein [unclassified Lysobacter]KQZ59680.1 hypothetical protein ASD53_05600 [Lysobacter sp. Root559]KRC36731.1 hypothetical protein ASE10_06375 [Lysobacter sp. Root76]KRD66827.1 hypothetical protein ASE45_16030 [Lysobacter sp. Root96]